MAYIDTGDRFFEQFKLLETNILNNYVRVYIGDRITEKQILLGYQQAKTNKQKINQLLKLIAWIMYSKIRIVLRFNAKTDKQFRFIAPPVLSLYTEVIRAKLSNSSDFFETIYDVIYDHFIINVDNHQTTQDTIKHISRVQCTDKQSSIELPVIDEYE